jgi:hypothetical protein
MSFDASGNMLSLCCTGVRACFKEKYLLVFISPVRPFANNQDLTIDNLSLYCGVLNDTFSRQ